MGNFVRLIYLRPLSVAEALNEQLYEVIYDYSVNRSVQTKDCLIGESYYYSYLLVHIMVSH